MKVLLKGKQKLLSSVKWRDKRGVVPIHLNFFEMIMSCLLTQSLSTRAHTSIVSKPRCLFIFLHFSFQKRLMPYFLVALVMKVCHCPYMYGSIVALPANRKKCITPRPGCSKLTTSLVNETLKFQTLISQICQYFLLKKCEKLLQCKSFSHFFNKKYLCIWL